MSATQSIAVAVDGLKVLNQDGNKFYTIDIGSPIMDSVSGEILGYIISTMKATYFSSFLDSVTIGDSGFGILLDGKGNIIYHPNSDLIGTKINSDKLSRIADDYNKGLAPESGAFEFFYENTNQSTVIAYFRS